MYRNTKNIEWKIIKMVEGIDLTIESLKEQLNEIRQTISQCRKKGLDTKIAEIKIIAIPSKINMVEITKDFKDIQKINVMLNNVRIEIDAIEKDYLSINNEISESSLNEIYALMEKMDKLLNSNKIKEAKVNYLICINIYKSIIRINKKKVFERLNNLRTRLSRG